MKASELVDRLNDFISKYGDQNVLLENLSDCGVDSDVTGVFIGFPSETLSGPCENVVHFYIEGGFE